MGVQDLLGSSGFVQSSSGRIQPFTQLENTPQHSPAKPSTDKAHAAPAVFKHFKARDVQHALAQVGEVPVHKLYRSFIMTVGMIGELDDALSIMLRGREHHIPSYTAFR